MEAESRRKLIVDGFDLFMTQGNRGMADEAIHLQQLSRQYRECLYINGNEFRLGDSSQVLIRIIQSVWQLADVCFLTYYNHDGEFLRDIVGWVADYVSLSSDQFELKNPFQEDEFDWTLLLRALATGQFNTVLEVLDEIAAASPKKSRDLEYLSFLVSEKANSFNFLGTYDRFKEEYERIQEEGRRCGEIPTISSNTNLLPFFKLLSGDMDIIMENFERWYDSWYEIMISIFLYVSPVVSREILSSRMDNFIQLMGSKKERIGGETELFRTVFQGEIMKLYRLLLEKSSLDEFRLLWSLAHMSHIFHNAKLLPEFNFRGSSPFQKALEEYVELISGEFWSISAVYLSRLTRDYPNQIKELLVKTTLPDDEKKLISILDTCRNLGIQDGEIDAFVCQRMAKMKIAKGNNVAAFYWYTRSGDVPMANSVLYPIVQSILEKADAGNFDAICPHIQLGRFSQQVSQSEVVTFINEFRRMKDMHVAGNVSGSLDVLVGILQSRVSKDCFVPSASFPLVLNPLVLAIIEKLVDSPNSWPKNPVKSRAMVNTILRALQDAEIQQSEAFPNELVQMRKMMANLLAGTVLRRT